MTLDDAIVKAVQKLISDGFGFEIFKTNEENIILSAILPYPPFHQVSRAIDKTCTIEDFVKIYWDLSRTIRARERRDVGREKDKRTNQP